MLLLDMDADLGAMNFWRETVSDHAAAEQTHVIVKLLENRKQDYCKSKQRGLLFIIQYL